MKKKFFLIGTLILFIVILLSGCQEQKATTTENNFEKIELESNVVELVDASLEFKEANNVILKVDVKYLFHNIAGRQITVTVNVEFYDKSNNLLSTGGPKYISLPKDYVETSILGANIISLSGEKAAYVDHVEIVASE